MNELGKNAVLISGIEIAQSVRHEARNLLNESQLVINQLRKSDSHKDSEDSFLVISEKLKQLLHALQKIRTITKPPKKVLQIVSLEEVWREAVDMIQGRRLKLNVKLKQVGSLNIKIEAFRDWLRHAFMNLLMNSLDAFESRKSRKSNREIILKIEPSSTTEDNLKLVYSDNAGA